jgi:hypothetical protein
MILFNYKLIVLKSFLRYKRSTFNSSLQSRKRGSISASVTSDGHRTVDGITTEETQRKKQNRVVNLRFANCGINILKKIPTFVNVLGILRIFVKCGSTVGLQIIIKQTVEISITPYCCDRYSQQQA